MNQGIVQIKLIHKKLAEEIKFWKSLRPQSQESKIPEEKAKLWLEKFSSLRYYSKREYFLGNIESEMRIRQYEYRFRHIAYCLNKGRSYEQIETPKEQNKLYPRNWEVIKKYQEEYRKLYEAHVCVSQ
jgi:hypothetical protein